MLHNIEAHNFQLLRKAEDDLKEVKIEKNKTIQTHLMINVQKLKIKFTRRKEEEGDPKAQKIKKKLLDKNS